MVLMMEYLVSESHKSCMELCAPWTRTDITDERYHEFRLELKKLKNENKHLSHSPASFEDVDEPDLMDDDPNIPLQRREGQGPGDPEFKGTVESLSRESKHIVLETEDDALIECTVQWISMYNKTIQQKIMERVVKQETKEDDAEAEEEQEEPKEPTVPPPTKVSMECQTDDSFLSDQKTGSSSQKEEPAPPEGSAETEVSGEQQTDIQKDDTAPKPEPAKRFYHGADITGNEYDSVFRNFPGVFLMVILVNGQASTIKVIQLQLNTDICSGMLSTPHIFHRAEYF